MPGAAALTRLGLRQKLLLAFLLVLGITGTTGTLAGFSLISRAVSGESMRRVEADLGSAWAAIEGEKARVQAAVAVVAQDELLREALRQPARLRPACARLEAARLARGLDFLNLLDRGGRLLARSRSAQCGPDGDVDDPLIGRALSGEAGSGARLLSSAALRAEGDELAQRARIEIEATERALPTARRVEDRGIALEAAMPVFEGEHVVGVLLGGVLLNRRLDLVDRVRDAVFGNATLAGRPIGTVTFFLGDVRIATNVMTEQGARALGTRVSREVYEKVIGRGERFADRAFVVNDWYLSAYDPLRDASGGIIGIVYVGLLERKALEYREGLAAAFLWTSLLAVLVSAAAALYLSAWVRRPVARLVDAVRSLSRGELGTRVELENASSEMRELARAFNSMAQALQAREQQLQQASASLQSAYAEAADKNRAYLETLGFVTHELKSPLAAIVFGVDAVREGLLGPLSDGQREALRAAAESADSLRDTIANYLSLSQIEEGRLEPSRAEVRVRTEVVSPLLARLRELFASRGMRVQNEIDPQLIARCDPALTLSVFQNLLSNAIKYGREGGLIRLEGARGEDGWLRFSVFNEGGGFDDAAGARLFKKFSRLGREPDTKAGTGVGLYVTRQIVERHGGRIWAESEPGRWARFTFTLPSAEEQA